MGIGSYVRTKDWPGGTRETAQPLEQGAGALQSLGNLTLWIVTPHSKQSHAVLTLCDKGGLHVEFVCHSERRTLFSESDEVVNKKIKTALEAALHPIFCIGETLQERVENRVEEVLERQIRQGLKDVSAQDFHEVVIAYEPVWAIGTGRTATAAQAQQAHAFVRSVVASISDRITAEKVRIQYGGSVKPENAQKRTRANAANRY